MSEYLVLPPTAAFRSTPRVPAPLVLPAPSPPAPSTTQGSTFTDVSAKKRFVVPSVDVDDSLDVGPEDCDEAGNVITRDEVHVNGVPDFLAFVAHGKRLNMHGCVEAARRSVSRVTELSKQLRQQGATVPQVVNTFCADSQDELVLFAFALRIWL